MNIFDTKFKKPNQFDQTFGATTPKIPFDATKLGVGVNTIKGLFTPSPYQQVAKNVGGVFQAVGRTIDHTLSGTLGYLPKVIDTYPFTDEAKSFVSKIDIEKTALPQGVGARTYTPRLVANDKKAGSIQLSNIIARPSNTNHEVFNSFFYNSGIDPIKFNKEWEKAKKTNPDIAAFDSEFNDPSKAEAYHGNGEDVSKDPYALASERFALMGKTFGKEGLNVIPKELQSFYSKILKSSPDVPVSFDATPIGVAKNTITGLPKASLNTLQSVGQMSFRAYAGVASALTGKPFIPKGQFQTELYGTDKPITLESAGRELRLANPNIESKGIFRSIDPALGVISGTLDAIPGGEQIRGLFNLSKEAKTIIAGSKDIQEISSVLKKEVPTLTNEIADTFSKIFLHIDSPQDVETALNRIKLSSQEAEKLAQQRALTPKLEAPTSQYKYTPMDNATLRNGNVFLEKQKAVSPKPDPLTQEAQKYKSAKDFNDNFVDSLSNKRFKDGSFAKDTPHQLELKKALNILAKQSGKNPNWLTDFYNQATGKAQTGLDTLATEARKYKSAEEFVKAQTSATQYGDYTPALRKYGAEGYTPITKLGVKPDEMVTIYRGIDDIKGNLPRKINNGDFVTTDFDSALSYAGSPKDVVSMEVPAKYLSVSEAGDFKAEPFYTGSEYIYTKEIGNPITKSQLTDLWKKANEPSLLEPKIAPTTQTGTAEATSIEKLAEQSLNKVDEQYRGEVPSLPRIVVNTNTPVKYKVGMIDYMRTPDRVLKKIGLENVSNSLREGYDNYLKELPVHLQTITDWSKEVPKESNIKIFKYLDGQKIDLAPNELKVAGEIKEYLAEWANRLGLPEDNQISHYITHIFDFGVNQKEFDEEIANMIKDKVPGSVYDPFLEKRLGAKGFVEDTWRALDAYVKRAVRKANMDPALEQMKRASHNLEESQLNYVQRLGARINMRPTEWDNLLDNTIKQIVGYKFGQRPTAVISGTLRKMVYRGALGLNITSAIKNLTQGVNTFAKLGVRDTMIGYIKLLKPGMSKELEEVGILRDGFIQDRTLSATKQTLQKIDKGLFTMFQLAEKVNRGSAYFGAKAKALREGKNIEEATEYGKKIVRDTQFVFGSIDTPVAMQGDIAKTLFQFGSFSQKQTEFLSEMIKNKEFAGIIRYIVASLAIVYTIGRVFNIKGSDFNPLNYFSRFGKPPSLALPTAILKAVLNVPDQYGKTPTTKAKVKDIIYSGTSLVPAGVQASKLLKGKGLLGNTPQKKKATKKEDNPFNNF